MPESAALRRWRKGDFFGVERDYAKAWREALEKLDLTSIRTASQARGTLKLPDLAAVKAAADDIALANGRRYAIFKGALDVLNIPESYRPAILRRWKEQGGPALRDFAPYADYVFRCEVFFHLAIATAKIDAVRTSNRNDMAYLFYLPFCKVFTSFDRLHAAIAPLFMGEDQAFVPGQELKDDLAKLDAQIARSPKRSEQPERCSMRHTRRSKATSSQAGCTISLSRAGESTPEIRSRSRLRLTRRSWII